MVWNIHEFEFKYPFFGKNTRQNLAGISMKYSCFFFFILFRQKKKMNKYKVYQQNWFIIKDKSYNFYTAHAKSGSFEIFLSRFFYKIFVISTFLLQCKLIWRKIHHTKQKYFVKSSEWVNFKEFLLKIHRAYAQCSA